MTEDFFNTVAPDSPAYLPALLKAIRLPEDSAAAVLSYEGKLPQSYIQRVWWKLLNRIDYQSDIAEAGSLLNTYNEMAALVLYCELTRNTLTEYRAKKLPVSVFLSSMTEITVWERACRADIGKTGLNHTGWVGNSLRLSLFRIGRFQFEPSVYHSRDCSIGGIEIRNGEPVLNVHIPEDGPMSRELRLETYRQAYKFFDAFQSFPKKPDGSILFACDSWLLYPAHWEFLPESSNIRDFLNDFTLMDSWEHRFNYDILWRMFGPHCTRAEVDALAKTSLQKAYAKHLNETECTGGAYGIFLCNGETFKK